MTTKIIRSVWPAAFVAGALLAAPADAGRKPHDVSWGKPNVSFAAYRQDTLDCANQTYGLDVGMKAKTMGALASLNANSFATLVSDRSFYARQNGSGAAPANEAGIYRAALSSVEPNHVMFQTSLYDHMFDNAARSDVIDQLQAVLDYCLTQRGYRKFRLTDGQRHALKKHPKDSGEREHFLHALGSDPQVLAAQRL